MRGRISGLSTLCKRFAAVLRRCDVESFLNIGRLYPEIAPMEKRIDMHIDLLRRDEFREMECVSDVVKYVLFPCVTLGRIPDNLDTLGYKLSSTIWQKRTLTGLSLMWVNAS